MQLPKTTWHYSSKTEADRVLHAAAKTFNRFYDKHCFLVLPHRVDGQALVVYLPNLKLKKQLNFIKKIKQIDPEGIPACNNLSLTQLVEKALVKQNYQLEKEGARDLQKTWQTKEKKFWSIFSQLFPEINLGLVEVEIRPTSFGSLASFDVATPAKKIRIKLYIRVDQPAAQIAEAILSSFFSLWVQKKDQSWTDNWEEKEAVIDFLMKQTIFKSLFPDYQATLESLRKKQSGKLVLESQKYLKKLGMASGEIFSFENGEVKINQKTTFKKLTDQEEKLLRLLVRNKNQLCSFETIGDLLWQEDAYDSFSPWAISKLVQRLRKKFQVNGLSPALIQAQRGKGYLLRD